MVCLDDRGSFGLGALRFPLSSDICTPSQHHGQITINDSVLLIQPIVSACMVFLPDQNAVALYRHPVHCLFRCYHLKHLNQRSARMHYPLIEDCLRTALFSAPTPAWTSQARKVMRASGVTDRIRSLKAVDTNTTCLRGRAYRMSPCVTSLDYCTWPWMEIARMTMCL